MHRHSAGSGRLRPTLPPAMSIRLPALLLSLSAVFAPAVWAQSAAAPLPAAASAHAAAAALQRGAMVMDIRPADEYAAGHLPGAVSVPLAQAPQDRETLQALVSQHGLDLSREVLLVGQPGDPQAQRLQAALSAYATGRVGWLVGGMAEWTLSGHPSETRTTRLAPVPQWLVPLQPAPDRVRMAGAPTRDLAAPADGVADRQFSQAPAAR